MNLETGKVSPQYHLVFNDTFSTVYSDGQFDLEVWDSLVCSNLDLHIDAMPTKLDDPTIIFPFSSSKENGGGSTDNNNNNNNDDNNDDNNSNNDDDDTTVPLPTIPLPSLPTRDIPVPLPPIPLPSQAKGVDCPLPSLPPRSKRVPLPSPPLPSKVDSFLLLTSLPSENKVVIPTPSLPKRDEDDVDNDNNNNNNMDDANNVCQSKQPKKPIMRLKGRKRKEIPTKN